MEPTIDLLPLLIPAAAAMLALPFGMRVRSEDVSVRAVYLFHRSGDSLATVASDRPIPFEASQLAPVLGAVREFVETSDPRGRGFYETRQRFGEEGFVAVRGEYVSACAVFRGGADGTLRRELARFVQEFEARNEGNLGTWEQAADVAEAASSAISRIVGGTAGLGALRSEESSESRIAQPETTSSNRAVVAEGAGSAPVVSSA